MERPERRHRRLRRRFLREWNGHKDKNNEDLQYTNLNRSRVHHCRPTAGVVTSPPCRRGFWPSRPVAPRYAARTRPAKTPKPTRGLTLCRLCLRPTVSSGQVEYTVPADLWPAADASRAAFAASPAAAALAADAAAPPPPLDVAAAFLEHLLVAGGAPAAAADTRVLARLVYVDVRNRFVGADTDIHAAVQDRDEVAQRRILRAVLAGRAAFPVRIDRASMRRQTQLLRRCIRAPFIRCNPQEHAPPRPSALWAAANASPAPRVLMVALFGGQGNVDDYLAELEALDDVYRPLAGPLLERAAAVLARAAATPEAVASGTSLLVTLPPPILAPNPC